MDENQHDTQVEINTLTASTVVGNKMAIEGEKPSIDDTLLRMNINMSTMAGILEKIYTHREHAEQQSQPLRGKRPTGNKRPLVVSDVSERDGQSESEMSSSQSDRKRRRRTDSEDELSLYAADSEDDLASLTSSMQTSRVATDNARENTDGVSQVLDDLAKSFGDDNGEKSPDIQPKLAEIVTKRWGKKLPPEKLKGLIEKYNTPGNCPSLICQSQPPNMEHIKPRNKKG